MGTRRGRPISVEPPSSGVRAAWAAVQPSSATERHDTPSPGPRTPSEPVDRSVRYEPADRVEPAIAAAPDPSVDQLSLPPGQDAAPSAGCGSGTPGGRNHADSSSRK